MVWWDRASCCEDTSGRRTVRVRPSTQQSVSLTRCTRFGQNAPHPTHRTLCRTHSTQASITPLSPLRARRALFGFTNFRGGDGLEPSGSRSLQCTRPRTVLLYEVLYLQADRHFAAKRRVELATWELGAPRAREAEVWPAS
jgi:hypothetical protein